MKILNGIDETLRYLTELRKTEADIEEQRMVDAEATQNFNNAQKDHFELQSKIARLEQSIEYEKELESQKSINVQEIQKELERINKEHKEDSVQINQISSTLSKLEQTIITASSIVNGLEQSLNTLEGTLQGVSEQNESITNEINELNTVVETESVKISVLSKQMTQIDDQKRTINLLKKISNKSIAIYRKDKKYFAPRYVQELKKILKKNINADFLSGGTDLSLSVTKERKDISSVIYMNSISELNYIKNNKEYIEVGGSTPLIELESYIKKYYPDFTKILKRYGSPQIRNVATVAGNIATASPIGDCLPLLLSLNAQVVLQGVKKTKILFLDNFFISYRKTKLKKGQFIHSIRIPVPEENTFKAYKVSKRLDDDISSVCAAFNLEIVNNKIKDIRIAYGGMAPIPKRAIYCEKILSNSLVTDEIINKAKEALEKDFKPITDMRASRSYRMEVAKNLLEKCCAEIKQKKLIGLHV